MASCHSDPEVCAPSRCHHIFRTDLFCGPFAGAQWNELFAFPLRSYILFFGRALARWLGSVCTCPPLAWWCQRGQRRGQQEEAGRTLLPVGENHAIGVTVPALAHVCHMAITGLGLSFPHGDGNTPPLPGCWKDDVHDDRALWRTECPVDPTQWRWWAATVDQDRRYRIWGQRPRFKSVLPPVVCGFGQILSLLSFSCFIWEMAGIVLVGAPKAVPFLCSSNEMAQVIKGISGNRWAVWRTYSKRILSCFRPPWTPVTPPAPRPL